MGIFCTETVHMQLCQAQTQPELGRQFIRSELLAYTGMT